MFKPDSEWPKPKKTRDELVAEIKEEAEKYVGNAYEFSQPIQLRFNELISGVRSDVAVKVYGDDMDVLAETGKKIADVLQRIPGATEVKVEQTGGLPMLTVKIDREKTARYGLNIGDVQKRSRSPPVVVKPASCSKVTAASISWSDCQKRCVVTWMLCVACRSRCRRKLAPQPRSFH
jgi:uncharacterized alkaline shock family protein YloU